MLPWVRQVRAHQLFFAGIREPSIWPAKRGHVEGGLAAQHSLPPRVDRPRPGPVQLRLMDALARRYRYGSVDLRREPVPDNPWLVWALRLADNLAESRGLSDIVQRALTRTLVMVLADYREGEMIRYADVAAAARRRGTSIRRVTEVLETMGILTDKPAAFDAWLTTKVTDLAPAIRREVHRWAQVLRDGGPRTRPRDQSTIRVHVYALLPALAAWSARYEHLRQVTRDDVLDHLSTLHGFGRQRTLVAHRSLFAWAKQAGVVFTDPTHRIPVGGVDDRVFQPLEAADVARTVHAAETPQARVFVALAAVHAARPGAIRALQLDDVDLGNRRLTIAGRTRPLDELTHQILLDWIEHRRQRWPHTANPHLLLSSYSATGTGPVAHPWVARLLRGLPATIERLRIDRQLEEALVSGADPLHLAEVFALDTKTALRYAASARQLLGPHHADPSASPRTEGSEAEDRANPPWGSN